MANHKIAALVGMCGSGKSVVCDMFVQKGWNRIYFGGVTFNMLYNFATSILRALGDSKAPLKFLAVTAVLNVFLNYFTIAILGMGVDGAAISKRMFDTKSLEYYKLMRTALDNIKTYEDGRIAVLYLSEEDFNNANIDEGGAVGIVALPTSIEGVQAGVYIRERNKGEFKISLRSVD